MRNIFFTLALICAVITGLAQSRQHYVVEIGDFTKLVVNHAVNVDYRSVPDSAGLAVFDAPASLVNFIQFKNNGKDKVEVVIESDNNNNVPTGLPTVTVYSRFLTHVEISADSTVRVLSVNAGPKFKAVLVGNGRLAVKDIVTEELTAKIVTGRGQIAIEGKTNKASLSVTGVGTIQADQLEAATVSASVNGPCTIGCLATQKLTVKGLGPGTVYYGGEPAEVKNHSIAGKAKPL